MTAWIAIVIPLCLIANCAVDFLKLEYGSGFQDNQLCFWCLVSITCALIVDIVNFVRRKK